MPNITKVTSLQGETVNGQATTSTAYSLTGVADDTGTPLYTTLKTNLLLVANPHASTDAVATISFTQSGGTPRNLAVVTIPAQASLDVLSGPLYVNAGDALGVAVTGTAVDVTVSYEKLMNSED
jgi:hypothetical protein